MVVCRFCLGGLGWLLCGFVWLWLGLVLGWFIAFAYDCGLFFGFVIVFVVILGCCVWVLVYRCL